MSSQPGPSAVLYVDPNEGTRERVTARFEESGVAVETAVDVKGARQRLAAGRPACVVSEYALPTEDGLSFLESTRETYGDIPFVLFTDSGNEQIASKAVTAGVSEYIPKRGTDKGINQLVVRVQSLTEEHTTPGQQIAESLKDGAMNRAPAGITIADMRLPDEPLIYVNEAFERLTGYSAAESLGRNCRFLQGKNSDPEKIARMRDAIENDTGTAVELRNYKKNGREFWNRIEIAPIRSEDGEVTHYVGYQTDVSARKEAEIEARNRAVALEQKQSDLESLLDRIDGLLLEVSEQVIHTRTKSAIKQQVCDAFVHAEGYSLAWIGDHSPVDGSITIDAIAQTDDGADPEQVDSTSPLVERALSEGRVVFDRNHSRAEADRNTRVALRTKADGSSSEDDTHAVVPVTYREATYGMLGIRTDDDHLFDEHEAVVLSTIGRIVGTALNAVQTQSLVQGESVIELQLSVGPEESFVGLSGELDCQLHHVGTISPPDYSGTVLFFEVDGSVPEELATAAEQRDGIDEATVIRAGHGESGLVRLSVVSSSLIDVLVERGGTITDAIAEGGIGTVTVQLAKETDPRKSVEEFKNRVPDATLNSYREDQRPQRTNQEFFNEVNAALTDRQRDALKTAYVSGFFDWPRKASGEDVSAAMDISKSTFHQHLRAAEHKLLDAFYDRH
jgi:PAS domain S-box-containing protein